MYWSWIWIELCAPLISFMMFVTYSPCCPPGSLSGVSKGVIRSERLLKTLAATGAPAVLPAGRFCGRRGGGGLASAARFAGGGWRVFLRAACLGGGVVAWLRSCVVMCG